MGDSKKLSPMAAATATTTTTTSSSRRSSCHYYLLCCFVAAAAAVCLITPALTTGVDANSLDANVTAKLSVDASVRRPIPSTLFGIFFEEINHAGAGGLWAELVSNRGFEAGGPNTPSNIDPWLAIGDASSVVLSTDRSSPFERNKVALRMDVLCDVKSCPSGGVGVYNPGFWGMNIEEGKKYKLVLYVRSSDSIDVTVSLTGSNGARTLATTNIKGSASDVSDWTKVEALLEAKDSDHGARLELRTSKKGVIWFDQVSLMPEDTYKGHGFRSELVEMLKEIKPRFIRFPGGCFVEGEWLRNAFRWKESVGPWEERPGHFGDVWMYWTDDGLGHYEFFQLAEDLDTVPIWVFNNGISHQDQVDTSSVLPFVQEALDGIEFARGDASSKWGSLRASMGHPEPFKLKYVAVGNEDCGKKNYRGNYLKFYEAIKRVYPDIQIISNCDGSARALDHPADYYDFHVYTSASNLFSMSHQFDRTSRSGPKAFVSEYAVTGKDAGTGSLLAALGEAAFLIGVEKNSDIVEMASYAPLFVNTNDRRWNPDAIVFNASMAYGTPSYWMQRFFAESSGGSLVNSTLQTSSSSSLVASAITYQDSKDQNTYLRIKVVNFASSKVNLKITVSGSGANTVGLSGSTKTELTSANVMDENSFQQPNKVAPAQSMLQNAGKDMDVLISPNSITSFDLLIESNSIRTRKSGPLVSVM